MKKLIIKRSEWLRGEGGNFSWLQRAEDGKKCCLGFLALSCGLPESNIEGIASPEDVSNSNNLWPIGILDFKFHNTPITEDLMRINDRQEEDTTESKRESLLKKTFAMINIDVEFVD